MTTIENPISASPAQTGRKFFSFLRPRPVQLWRAFAEATLLSLGAAFTILLISTHTQTLLQYTGLAVASAVGAVWLLYRWQPAPQTSLLVKLAKRLLVAGLMALVQLTIPIAIMLLGGRALLANGLVGVPLTAGLLNGFTAGSILLAFWLFWAVWQRWQLFHQRRLYWSLINTQLMAVAGVTVFIIFLAEISQVIRAIQIGNLDTLDGILGIVIHMLNISMPGVVLALAISAAIFLALQPAMWWLAMVYTNPTVSRVSNLAKAAAALRTGDLSARVTVAGQDELAALQTDFNAMAAALENAQTQLRTERDMAAQLLESKKVLVANVSHELRTPVATLRASLESHLNRSTAAQPTELAAMHNELLRLQRLIDDLFTLSRTESNALPLNLQPVAVAPLAEQVLTALRPLAEQSGSIELLLDLPANLPNAHADPDRLAQALTNLMRNAIQHTPPGGLVQLSAQTSAAHVQLTVRDTGSGITPEHLPHLWERFYQVDEDSRGSGLGLALVKELIEAMGGTVAVESELGQGSSFTIRLALAA